MLSLCSCAEFFGGADYELSEDGTYAEVVGLNHSYKRVTIAAKYKGVPVKVIASRAFENAYNTKSVKIAASITEIGNEAFLDCSSLEKVKFAKNSELTTIGASAFKNCKKLQNVEIPESVTKIGNSAFECCESFSKIKIPDNVVEIGDNAFHGCFRTASIEIGKGVTSISRSAFSGLERVESLSISLETGILDMLTSNIFGNNMSISNVFGNSLKAVIITGGTMIPEGALRNCSNIKSVKLPDSITSIGELAFANCYALKSIVIPASVESISYGAFYNCSALKTVYYGGTAEEWAEIAINNTYGYNDKLINATRYYYSESEPTVSGNYWHYDSDGNIVIW